MTISLLKLEDLKMVRDFYDDVTDNLRKKGIDQWDFFYPNRFVIKNDLKLRNLFGIIEEKRVIGVIVLNTMESKQYKTLHWGDQSGNHLVIHRLGVHPLTQGKGYGQKLLHFAEEFAQTQGYTSIRLDVYSGNLGALKLYERNGYRKVGSIKFPFRSVPYFCLEKVF